LENVLNNGESAKRFLLGDVSESERAQIEDRFIADDNFYDQLLIAEDDLIDDYVRGDLSAAERALFERTLSASQTRDERVKFAQSLLNSASGGASDVASGVAARPVSRWLSLSRSWPVRRQAAGLILAAASLVLMFGGLWFLIDGRRARHAPQRAQTSQPTQTSRPTPDAEARLQATPGAAAQQQSPTPEARQQPVPEVENSNREPARERPKRTKPVIAAFTLSPGLVRGASGANSLALRAGTKEVRLRLTLDDTTYKNYRALLSTPEGRKVWSRDVAGKRSSKSALTLTVPANLLKSGDYVLELSGANDGDGWESVADYSFRVVRN
jgi:hypothetical protein